MAQRMGLGDFYDLLKRYARQELLDPLRPIPRWIGFGLVGSLLLMIGSISLLIALLRVLQEETGSIFAGNLSWAPHAITLLAAIVALGLLVRQIKKRTL